MVMGCYGIGINRIVASLIEQKHDENGLMWPLSISPFHVLVLPVNVNHKQTMDVAVRIHDDLVKENIEVLLDDRDERAGVKFKDADLIGIPLRVTVSQKTLSGSSVEIRLRRDNTMVVVNVGDVVNEVRQLVSGKEQIRHSMPQ
jgi:prolyl-tRNA synthetase